jgi:cell division protein FtsL
MNVQIRLFQSDTHRARALLSEERARSANDKLIKREWQELAIEWHLLASTPANHEFVLIEAA